MEQDDEAYDAIGGGAEDRGDGAELGGALGVVVGVAVGHLPHSIDEEEDDTQDDEPEDDDGGEAREIAADEAEDVVVPVVTDLFEGDIGKIVLRGGYKKEHYGGVSVVLSGSSSIALGLDAEKQGVGSRV